MLLPMVSRPVNLGVKHIIITVIQLAGLLIWGVHSNERTGLVYNCWPSSAQSFSGSSPAGLIIIFCYFRLETPPTCRARYPYFKSKLHCDWRSVNQYVLVSSPVWGSWPDIYYCLTVTVLFLRGVLSDETTSLSFVYATGPRQRSLSRVWVPWDSRPYFTVSILRLPFSSPPTTRRVTMEVFDPPPHRSGQVRSLSHIATDGQSVCLSWCRAPCGAHDQILITVWQLLSCPWEGALSDERTGLSFVSQPAVLGQIIYKDSVRTSQETHYISAIKPNRLMLFRGNSRCLPWESYEIHRYTLWAECRVLVC
jgi:hypothetical protein